MKWWDFKMEGKSTPEEKKGREAWTSKGKGGGGLGRKAPWKNNDDEILSLMLLYTTILLGLAWKPLRIS